MPWCPKCKEEYKDGISICPDCNTALVESLDSNKIANDIMPVFTFETKDLAEKFASYLSYAGIMAMQTDNEDNTVTISVRQSEIKKAKKYFAAFYSVEATNALEKEFAEMKETSEKPVAQDDFWSDSPEESEVTLDQELEEALEEVIHTPEAYEKRAALAEEAKFTAITFAVFGVLLIILDILGSKQLIPLFNTPFLTVLGFIMSIAFFVVSYSCLKNRKKYLAEAIEEEELTNALTAWLKENFTEDIVNEIKKQSESNNESDEICYFKIISKMKQMIIAQFGEIDESYLEYLTDDYFNKYIALDEVNIIDSIDEE